MLQRREFLMATAAALSTTALRAQPSEQRRILVYTRSAGFEHSVVKVKDGKPCLVDRVMTELAAKNNFVVECTKDGRVFLPGSIEKFDAFFFFTTGDLTAARSVDGSPAMPKEGKKALLDAIAGGKGFIGSHSATDTFHSPGDRWKNQAPKDLDPYIQMLGGEFIKHGAQQAAKIKVIDPKFPGVETGDFTLHEEWYSLHNFADDLHVILAQDTAGMKGPEYARPMFPSTWARMHGKGRVFYTAMGHKEEVWEKTPLFLALLTGAMNWTTGRAAADIAPNIAKATPEASKMPVEK